MKQSQPSDIKMSPPLFSEKTEALVSILQRQSKLRLQKTLQVSAAIAKLNYERYQSWRSSEKRAALWMYSGDVYNGLDAYSLPSKQKNYAQENVVIISGLYGLLRPLDAIQPYRLEMKLPIKIGRTSTLYAYWQNEIKEYFEKKKTNTILLCASKEYAKAVTGSLPASTKTITPRFMQETSRGLVEKGLFAKYARGALARYAIENEINKPSALKKYNKDGFTFSENLSTEQEYVYIIPNDFTLKGRFIKR
jgi:cytoplasmic iron level regulating protein YaaA (DUF328/UPF0246 family)